MVEETRQENPFEKVLSHVARTHEEYRGSGRHVMTTIIGLASGLLYAFREQVLVNDSATWLIRAIILAVLQETTHYAASLLKARASNHYFDAEFWRLASIEDRVKKAEENAKSRREWSDRAFTVSDFLCFIAVGCFLWAVYQCDLFKKMVVGLSIGPR